MIAADTSVVVAAFASWHDQHELAARALTSDARLIAHCAFETYSVLTRLPPPHRAPPEMVRDFLAMRFAGEYLVLDPSGLRRILQSLPDLGISGGSVYDALVAATAKQWGATLLSLDGRAARTYARIGMDATLLA